MAQGRQPLSHRQAGMMDSALRRPALLLALGCFAILAPSTATARLSGPARRLAQAPVCEVYTITGECVTETGMMIQDVYREFSDTCKWSPDLVAIGQDLIKCGNKAYKCKGKGPKAMAVCGVACIALEGLKEVLRGDGYNKNNCGGSGSGGNRKSGGGFCFPGSATVRTADGQSKHLRDVHIGDSVLGMRPDGLIEYSQVLDVGVYMPLTRTAATVVDGVVATQMGAIMPKWFANHDVACMAIRTLDMALRALPRSARDVVATHMSKSVHGVLGRLLAVGPIIEMRTSL